ncbi:hypothetical protein QUB68_24130 [Microcoleus sp. A006_D1]|uniref:hypothetical protein n=1 Tax=Microcoleus sp. A006_D1 TaxID=3055267 RepID=UPI002FD6F06B
MKDAGGKAGDRRTGVENFDRAKDIVQRAEQPINKVYVKSFILENQNWEWVMGNG